MTETASNSFVSKLSQLIAVDVVYVFLSGWSFLDSYYRFFGVNPRWLDIPSSDILTNGFTVLFRPRDHWLLTVALGLLYILLIVIPVACDPLTGSRISTRSLHIWVALFMVIVLLPIYKIAGFLGESEARLDKGERSRLPSITFRARQSDYTGKLLFAKASVYYVQNLYLSGQSLPPLSLQIAVFRGEEMTDIKIVGYK